MARIQDVISFEVVRSLRKKSFWYATLALPAIILVIGGISYLSDHSTASNDQKQTQVYSSTAKLGVLDGTGLISQKELTKLHVTTEPSKQAGIAAVKNGSLTAFFYYPKDVVKDGVSVYAQYQGIASTPYNSVATGLLQQSVFATVSSLIKNQQSIHIIETTPRVTAVTYKNGQQTPGIESIVAPGLFWIGFVMLIIMLATLMISSTTEEKENRVAEILLTSIKGRTLILGKMIALYALGGVQLLATAIPMVIMIALLHNQLSSFLGFSLNQIPINVQAIITAALLFVTGFVMFTGLLVGIGAMFPSAQEASRYLFLGIIWVILPIYSLSYIITSPNSPIVQLFTYFPLTAPSTALLRNAAGELSLTQAIISLAIIAVSAVLTITFAIRAFQYGSMEYGRRISLRELLRKM